MNDMALAVEIMLVGMIVIRKSTVLILSRHRRSRGPATGDSHGERAMDGHRTAREHRTVGCDAMPGLNGNP